MPCQYIVKNLSYGTARNAVEAQKTDQEGALMLIPRNGLLLAAAAAAVAGAMAVSPARAEDAVKIGLILPMTGGQASTGKQIDNAVKLYMQQKSNSVANRKIEIILKDD